MPLQWSSRRVQYQKAAARVGAPEDGKSILAARWQRSPGVAAELLLHKFYLLFPLLRSQGQSCLCQKFTVTNPIFRCPRGSPWTNTTVNLCPTLFSRRYLQRAPGTEDRTLKVSRKVKHPHFCYFRIKPLLIPLESQIHPWEMDNRYCTYNPAQPQLSPLGCQLRELLLLTPPKHWNAAFHWSNQNP